MNNQQVINMKHTPGPWTSSSAGNASFQILSWRREAQIGRVYFSALSDKAKEITYAEGIANAKLIAAAPELLDNEKTNKATFEHLILELKAGRIDYAN